MSDQTLLSLQVRPGHPDFLDLPWTHPLVDWGPHTTRLVQVQRGLSRHEVVFVSYNDGIYAIKELPARIGEREYALLRELESHQLPAVTPVGHARARRTDEELSIVITRANPPVRSVSTVVRRPSLAVIGWG